MAKLERHEREELLRPRIPDACAAPRPRRLTPMQYVDFATQASRMLKPRKPRWIQGGEHWKL